MNNEMYYVHTYNGEVMSVADNMDACSGYRMIEAFSKADAEDVLSFEIAKNEVIHIPKRSILYISVERLRMEG